MLLPRICCAVLIAAEIVVSHPAPAQVVATGNQAVGLSPAAWKKIMATQPLPSKGCFTAKYPSIEWVPTTCVLAPPYPLTVGNGNDDVAQVTSGLIGSATGSFPNVTGVTQENDVGNAFTFGGTNDFSLQVNANTFPTRTASGDIVNSLFTNAACAGPKGPCKGWQQFVLTNYASLSPVGSNLYIQYWLLGFQSTFNACPSSQIPGGWESGLLGQWRSSNGGCFINSPATSVPIQNISDLSSLNMTASTAINGLDMVVLTTSNAAFALGTPTNFLGLTSAWTQSEFNVFGLWNASNAQFNAGSTISVSDTLMGPRGVPAGASCLPGSANAGTTGETNNLNLTCSCAANAGQILFSETNASNFTCSCPAAGQVFIHGSCQCPASGQTVRGGQCACPSGQVASTLNGVLQCGCPGNQQLVGGVCVSGFNKVQFTIQTGNDNAGSGDEITAMIDGQASAFCLKPSQNMQSDPMCNNGSGATDQNGNSTWNNWQQVTETFTLNPPVPSNQNLNELFVSLLQNSCGLSCDNWDLQSIKITLIDTTGALPQKTLLNVGNPRNNNNNNNCIARMKAPSNSSQVKFLLNGLNGGGTFSNGNENGQSAVCTSGNS